MIYGLSIGITEVHITAITFAIRGGWLPFLGIGVKKFGIITSGCVLWIAHTRLHFIYWARWIHRIYRLIFTGQITVKRKRMKACYRSHLHTPGINISTTQ